MRIRDWSSDLCCSDLAEAEEHHRPGRRLGHRGGADNNLGDVGGRQKRVGLPDDRPVHEVLDEKDSVWAIGRRDIEIEGLLKAQGEYPGSCETESRSEERDVGKGCVSTCRSRGS